MKLSDLKDNEVEVLRLSDLSPDEIEQVPSPKKSLGERVSDKLVGAKDYVSDKLQATGENLGESAVDLSKGITQGTTLGFADELGGVTAAGIDYTQRLLNKLGLAGKSPGQINEELKAQGFTGDLPSSASEIYREGQQATAKDFAKSEERSPWLYKSGELLGGIGAGIAATPVLGETGGSKLLDILNTSGKGAFAKELGKRAGIAALEAAPVGLAAGAGYSEGKLVGATPEEQEKLLEDTLKGGATGSLIGGTVKLASDVAPIAIQKGSEALDDLVKDLKFPRQIKKAFEIGKEGTGIRGSEASAKALAEEAATGKGVTDQLMEARRLLGQNIDEITKQATASGKVIVPDSDLLTKAVELGQEVSQNPKLLGKDASSQTFELISKLGRGELNPQEAYTLRKSLKEISQNQQIPYESRAVFQRFNDSLAKGIEDQVPGFKQALKDFHDYSGATEQLFSEGLDVSPQSLYGVSRDDLIKKMDEIIKKSGKMGTAYQKGEAGLNKFYESLESKPELLQKTGLDVNKIKDTLKEASDKSSIRQGIQGYEPHAGATKHLLSADTGTGVAYGAAHATGKAINMLGKLSKWPVDQMAKVGQKLQAGKAKFLGDALLEAIEKGDQVKKNAVIFAILQNPSARKEIAPELEGYDQE